MNKQEFEQRVVNSSSAEEMRFILKKRMISICNEISPERKSNIFEIMIRAAACKVIYMSLHNTLPPELKTLCDEIVKNTNVTTIAYEVKGETK